MKYAVFDRTAKEWLKVREQGDTGPGGILVGDAPDKLTACLRRMFGDYERDGFSWMRNRFAVLPAPAELGPTCDVADEKHTVH